MSNPLLRPSRPEASSGRPAELMFRRARHEILNPSLAMDASSVSSRVVDLSPERASSKGDGKVQGEVVALESILGAELVHPFECRGRLPRHIGQADLRPDAEDPV